jgi:hypothetical protein
VRARSSAEPPNSMSTAASAIISLAFAETMCTPSTRFAALRSIVRKWERSASFFKRGTIGPPCSGLRAQQEPSKQQLETRLLVTAVQPLGTAASSTALAVPRSGDSVCSTASSPAMVAELWSPEGGSVL